MGSLTSVPKVKAARPAPVVYRVVPESPASAAAVQTQTAADLPDASYSAVSDGATEGGAAAARAAGLLGRSRGAFSTVLTGFRGLLSQAAAQTPRKALLGE